MTPQELEEWRNAIRVSILTDLVANLYVLIARFSPDVHSGLLRFLDEERKSHELTLPKTFHPDEAGMLADEYRETLSEIIGVIEKKING